MEIFRGFVKTKKINLLLRMVNNDCKVSADVYIDDKSYQGTKGVEKLWRDWYN